MVIMSCMGDVALHDRLPFLWQRIEDAHYSYLEIDESPEKLQQKKKLQGYITEYLSLVPNECKFGLPETSKVFQRTVNELPDYSAYRAGIGWAALARYAANLLAQPWRKEYKVIRLYCGFFKHEVEANLVGSEALLQAMGYRPTGGGRWALDGPVCPDMAAAVSRDALIAQCECQIMASIWEGVWSSGGRVSWASVAAERLSPAAGLGVYCNMPAPCRCPPSGACCYPPYAPLYRYPVVPTAQLVQLDPERDERRSRRADGPSRASLKATDDGTGTYESWDYVFRNLSAKNGREGDSQSSDWLDRVERRKGRPTTVDLEDGLRALDLDRSPDEEAYRTAKVNENLMRLKREQEARRAKRRPKKPDPVGNPSAAGLVAPKVADKVQLLSKREIQERKEVLKLTANGEAKRTKAPERWACGACTFENARGAACAMCGKSRAPPAPDPAPLAAGGRHCVACTLVNARHAARCDACGTPLDGCPTYI